MSMKQRHQTMSAIDASMAQEIVARAVEELNNPSRLEVVRGDNKELSVRWTLFAVFTLAGTITFLMFGVWLQTRIPTGLLVIYGSTALLVTLPIVLIIATGDVSVLRQIWLNFKLERQRLEGLSKTARAAMKLMKQAEHNRHEEKMAGMAQDAEIDAVKVQLMLLKDQIHMGQQPEDGLASPSFVPGEISEARKLVARYVLGDMRTGKQGLYKRGLLNPNKVNPETGQFTLDAPLPWSKRGEWRGENARDAYQIMMEPAGGAEPLLIEEQVNGRVVGYRWNVAQYGAKRDAYNVIGAVV